MTEPEVYTVPKDLMNIIYRTLRYYANEASYRGERTGGILQGCPRAPDPTPRELIQWANYAVKRIDREILKRETGE
jgi:hypothetical protein